MVNPEMKMPVDEMHLRHCMLYEFNLGRKATKATENICAAYGENALDVRKCQRWFARFRSGNTKLEDKAGRGRVSHFDKDALHLLLNANPRVTQQELAKTLNASQQTIARYLHEIDKSSKTSENEYCMNLQK